MLIEISGKKWRKQKHGTECSFAFTVSAEFTSWKKENYVSYLAV